MWMQDQTNVKRKFKFKNRVWRSNKDESKTKLYKIKNKDKRFNKWYDKADLKIEIIQ